MEDSAVDDTQQNAEQVQSQEHIMEIVEGSQIWIPDDVEVWKIATVTSVQGEGISATYTVDATPTNAKGPKSFTHAQIIAVDPSHLVDMDNMCMMNNMHEAPLLDLLRRRFLEKNIYTFTSNILISLNPFEAIPNLYDDPNRYYLIDSSIGETYIDNETGEELPPHVYQIANNALRALCDGRQGGDFSDQSVIISGESGAGKTENSKYVLGYLIEANNLLSSSTANTEESSFAEYLKEVLIQSSVVLEAFGNAKTLRNDNSSRFGKYIKLLYEKEVSSVDHRPYPRLVSAMTETFLLEKSRLTSVGKGERCYHIFYQLVSALDNEELRVQLGLHHGVAAFRMLSQGECFDNPDDKIEFVNTLDALKKLHFGGDDLSGILRLLATCLHLGNLDYQADTDKNDMVQISCSTLSVDQLAQNLGLDAGFLRTALITQKLVVRGRSSLKIKILSVDEVANNANALLKWMYSKLFDWIVTRINQCHSARYHADGRNHFIGILDIFGFEILRTNSFEQLCINYTNERLQQQFNQHVFVSEQDMYQIEGLAWQSVSFQDNQPVIDLISNNKKPLGLLQLLEEQGLLNRKPDDNALLFSFNHQHEVKDVKAKASAIYSKSKFGNNAFVVKHFAGDVTYLVDGFLTKNNDALQEDLMNTLKLSHDGFLRQVMGLSPLAPEVVEGETEETDEAVDDDATELTTETTSTATAAAATAAAAAEAPATDATASGKKMASAATVSLHFRTQLDALMNTLYSTSPHYIKCVKSNNKKKPIEFEATLVNQQLRYSGVLEVVRIRREGFPVRMTYKEFFVKYRVLLKGEWPTLYFVDPETLSNFDCKAYCAQIVDVAMTQNEVQIGKSMVFLRDQGRDAMQRAMHRYLERKALVIQSKYKSILARRRYLQQLIKIHVLKRFMKMSVPRKRYLMHLHAIRAIQRFYFYRIRRKRLILELRLRLAATRIQSNFRRSLVQHRFQYIRRKLIAIQSLYRTYRQRKSFVLRKLAAVYIQMYLRRFVYRRRYVKMVRSALRVQQMFRRHVAYARYQRQRWSLLLIQRQLRGFVRRQRYRQILRRVVLVQSIVRRFLARFVFVRAKACITMIQTHVRKHLATKRFMIMKGTTIGLQTWYRCCAQRRRYGRMKRHVVLVAALIRRFLARLRYRRQLRALIRLQRAVVAFLRNLRLRRRLTALHNVTEISPEKMRSFLATSPADASHLHKCTEPGQPKPVLRRLLHSVLLAPPPPSSSNTASGVGGNRTSVSGESTANKNTNSNNSTPLAVVVTDVLHTTYQDVVDVDSLGRTAFHYLALNPSFGTIDVLCSILNTYEFESSGTMEGLDEDEADTVDNARITRIKNDVAESISNTKLLEGWLKKKRGGFMWQRRWVVLSEDYIVYFNSNTVSTKDPKFAIPLEGCTVQRLPGSREPVFEVFAPNMGIKRTFFGSSSKKSMTFMCESEEDLQRWLIPLRAMAGVDTLRSTTASYVKWELRQTVLSQVDKAGNTPLHTLVMTASRGSGSGSDEAIKVLAWLIENGCNVSSQNLDGNTPLHLALLHRAEPLVVKCLLLKGADTKTVRNKQGQSVLELYRSDASYRDTYGDYFGDYAGSKPSEVPFKMKGYSYFSIYFGKQTFDKAQASMSDHPVLTISPLNSKRQLIESSRDIKDAVIAQNTADDSKSVYWGAMWHMSIPLENLQDESFLLVEYKVKADGPTISSAQISLDRQSVDSQRLVAQLAVPSDGGRQANPILAMKENSKLEVEILLTKKPRNVTIHQLSK